jgi:hypothetical protein
MTAAHETVHALGHDVAATLQLKTSQYDSAAGVRRSCFLTMVNNVGVSSKLLFATFIGIAGLLAVAGIGLNFVKSEMTAERISKVHSLSETALLGGGNCYGKRSCRDTADLCRSGVTQSRPDNRSGWLDRF